MDDDNTTSNESDTETCMVVEIQENELGEIVLVERPREQVFTDNRFCVVDCKIEPSEDEPSESPTFTSEDVQENIEIVYLPDYCNPSNGPVLLKQELLLQNDGEDFEEPDCEEGYEIVDSEGESFQPTRPAISPKVYRRGQKRTFSQSETGSKISANGVVTQSTNPCGETRLRSNPNVILKHQGIFHPSDRSWTLKLDTKDLVQTKSISSVTTIHTNPTTIRMDGSENETIPESRLVGKDIQSQTPGPNILPHKCKYCDRAFRQSVSLQIHSTLHSPSIPDGCHVS